MRFVAFCMSLTLTGFGSSWNTKIVNFYFVSEWLCFALQQIFSPLVNPVSILFHQVTRFVFKPQSNYVGFTVSKAFLCIWRIYCIGLMPMSVSIRWYTATIFLLLTAVDSQPKRNLLQSLRSSLTSCKALHLKSEELYNKSFDELNQS